MDRGKGLKGRKGPEGREGEQTGQSALRQTWLSALRGYLRYLEWISSDEGWRFSLVTVTFYGAGLPCPGPDDAEEQAIEGFAAV